MDDLENKGVLTISRYQLGGKSPRKKLSTRPAGGCCYSGCRRWAEICSKKDAAKVNEDRSP
ncbi:hypothetical protein FRX31_031426 [Thalictrum thalictroides]|uniref:Uncharacterized protein n=1 Tax=Thalictrum thalictroides TaxID=46969 RepID=A0A7J6V3Z1_THATH|nr:hypothetical protein FRX31_031426 [Thalictrum thalictroides]